MEIIKTAFDGVYLIKPTYFEDDRGYFVETFSEKELAKKTGLRLGKFVQDSQAYNRTKGTFRGIHVQIEPHAQIKLVWCTRGSIIDYVVDLRANSPTFGKWISFEISYKNRTQVLIPKGFGHAYYTLEDDTEVLYKFDDFYHNESNRTIDYKDSAIGLILPGKINAISEKDSCAKSLLEHGQLF